MKPPGNHPGGFYFPVLKRWKNGRALSELGHSGQTCNDFGRTMHVGGIWGLGARTPGGVGGYWGSVCQPLGTVNPWGLRDTMTERRRRDSLARPARGDPRWHRGDGQGRICTRCG